MFNKKDLQIIRYDDDLLNVLNRIKLTDLQDFIHGWYKIPELRGASNDLEAYAELDKTNMIRRLKTNDWPDGLHAYQIAQLKLKEFEKTIRKRWNIIKMLNGTKNINMHLEMENIQLGMENYMSNFFYCYVNACYHRETGSYIFDMAIVENEKDKSIYKNIRFGNMIYFPETNKIITPARVWIKEYDSHFKEALLDIFSANTLSVEAIHLPSYKSMNAFAEKETKNQTIFEENQLDTNPLDIRQKRQIGFEESYVKGTEQKKRIVPIDMEEMKEKYDNIKESFNWKSITGHRRLYVKLKLPLDANTPIQSNDYQDNNIEISITMEGLNISEGIRDLIMSGKIEKNPPSWLKGVVMSGTKKLIIDSDGVYQEVKDDLEVTKPRTI